VAPGEAEVVVVVVLPASDPLRRPGRPNNMAAVEVAEPDSSWQAQID
jgi:hypothetical protein